MARPTSLPEVQAVILTAIEAGNYRVTACAAAGIHRHTLQNWEKWGAEGKEPYAEFLAALQTAEAKAEMRLLSDIDSARAGTPGVSGADVWQTKAWILERRWPQRWAARVRTVVAEEVGTLVNKLRDQPELQRKVADVLAEGDSAPGTPAH